MNQLPENPLTNRRVLLVEDCPDQQRLMLHWLRIIGAEVTLECNGQAAVDSILKRGKKFDVIIMDFAMPVADGMEATSQLRDALIDTPIVAVTAHHSEELEMLWRAHGCNGYLRKPFGFSDLVKELIVCIYNNAALEQLSQ